MANPPSTALNIKDWTAARLDPPRKDATKDATVFDSASVAQARSEHRHFGEQIAGPSNDLAFSGGARGSEATDAAVRLQRLVRRLTAR